jgi:thiol-disulfide isomerase/thioredoxin
MLTGTLFFLSCNNNRSVTNTTIDFRIHNARGLNVVLEIVPFINEKQEIIDSAIIKSGDDVVKFTIKDAEERAYKIRIPETGFEIVFINDKPGIQIEAGLLQPQNFTIKNSPATDAVRKFMGEQLQMMNSARTIDSLAGSLRAEKSSLAKADSLEKASIKTMAGFFDRYKNFADTVSSPGAFLYIYNNVDFGKDYTALKYFINHALQRFPLHTQVKKLHDDTIEFLKVFEEEYVEGQQLPGLDLPDTTGNNYNTALSGGKYAFIDCWATWCGPCMQYDDSKKKLLDKFGKTGKLNMISVALDDDIANWKNHISANKLYWTQLIDTKIWKGEVFSRWRIDSIPFNFLIAPDGKIIRRAIPADSLVPVLSQYLK